jgi:hypothetical protein
MLSQKLDAMLKDAKIDLMSSLGNSIKILSQLQSIATAESMASKNTVKS